MLSTSSKPRTGRRQARAAGRPADPRGTAEAVLLRLAEPVYLADLQGAVLFANAAYRALFAGVAPAVATVLRSGEPVEGEETVPGLGGARIFVGSHAPVRDEAGAIVGVSGVYRDVTALRSATGTAAALMERLDDLTRLMAEWTFEVDADFRFRALSPRALEALGRPPRALIGAGLLDIGAFTDPIAITATPGARSPIDGRLYRTVDHRGGVHHSRISAVPVFVAATGAFAGYRGIGIDVSAEIAAEARAEGAQLRLLEAIESIFEGFALYDADDRMVLCNNRFRELYPDIGDGIRDGVTFEAMLRRSRLGADLSPDARERAIQRRLAAHRAPAGPFEERLSGDRWVLAGERPTRDGGIVSVYTDITELKRRERDLAISESIERDAREAAESASQAKSAFLANMSHELRTPLNAIIGFSEIMQKEMFGPLGVERYRDYAHDIHDSGKHLLDLINDVLDFSKIEAGKLVLHESTVAAATVVRHCHRLMTTIAETGGVALVIDAPAGNPALKADESKLKQILLNLLSNAIKFTPHGGCVTTRFAIEHDGSLVLAVADTGVGMRAEDIPRALSPFVQLEDPMTRRHQGTGLGLPLTKSLVELHGGTLAVASIPGSGTTVTLRFPRARVEAALIDG